MAREPQLEGPGEACEAPSQPVWGEEEVLVPEGNDQVDIVCAGELLQHEGVDGEEEAEADGEAGAQQHRPMPGSYQRQGRAHPQEVEGVQRRSKHHERLNERTLGATFFIILISSCILSHVTKYNIS